MSAAEKNFMKPRGFGGEKREPKEFDERVIEIARVSRVVKGGRRIRFRALLVLGDHKGRIGMGVAKANEVAEAVKKATALAKKHMVNVPIINGTIPHEVIIKHGGARIMLKPASEGTSIVAGGSVRTVAELAGITDLLAKSLGSSNKVNSVTATIKALTSFNPTVIEKLQGFEKKRSDATISKAENKKAEAEVKEPAVDEKPAPKKTATKSKKAAEAVVEEPKDELEALVEEVEEEVEETLDKEAEDKVSSKLKEEE